MKGNKFSSSSVRVTNRLKKSIHLDFPSFLTIFVIHCEMWQGVAREFLAINDHRQTIFEVNTPLASVMITGSFDPDLERMDNACCCFRVCCLTKKKLKCEDELKRNSHHCNVAVLPHARVSSKLVSWPFAIRLATQCSCCKQQILESKKWHQGIRTSVGKRRNKQSKDLWKARTFRKLQRSCHTL